MATVSVIVPNYNHAKYLRKRVESILAQTLQDYELILLDDCSTDGSREILAEYESDARVRVEFNEKNSGTPFKQWNKGVRMARGKYVWIAESDDYAEPAFLERMTAMLEELPDATFAYCRSQAVGEDGESWGHADAYLERLDGERWERDFTADGREECRRYFALCAPVPNASAAVFRKSAYEQAGGADERLRLCGDYKVWASLALLGKVAYSAAQMNSYRTHEENARTRAQQGGLDLAEYFYVMRWVVEQVAEPEALAGRPRLEELYPQMPAEMSGAERMKAARRAVSEVARWNLRYNRQVAREKLRAYFLDWEFAVVGKEFAVQPPNRWRFFLHRVHFYRRYAARMSWKQKLLNLGRVAGAPLVGYQKRHWPEQAYSRVAGAINRTLE